MRRQLDKRREESQEGLALVREEAARALSSIIDDEPLAIYVTGSFGRLEARFPKGSDLDLFFLYGPGDRSPHKKLSQLVWFELAAGMIQIARDLAFEDFSRDGAFLHVHNVWHVGRELGSQHEDAENGFTARLLLLLESRYVLNEQLYERLVRETIGFYYDDFQKNGESFRPTFLINDILRFWRTLCLNYEHKRNRKRRESTTNKQERAWRVESALANLKLRFSRLSTCYSMVIALAAEPTPVTADRVFELCATAPSDRWAVAAEHAPSKSASEAEDKVAAILDRYEGFLELASDEELLEERLASHGQRQLLRLQAADFGEAVSQLLLATCQSDQLRSLLI